LLWHPARRQGRPPEGGQESHSHFSVIIPILAKLIDLYSFGAGGLRKLRISAFWLISSALLVTCGGSGSQSGTKTSGITYRAFLTNTVGTPGVYIVDAQHDVHPNGLNPISAGRSPGMMVVTPNRAQTLVFSGYNTENPDYQFSIINNISETNAAHVTLPGPTESFVVSPDSSVAYIAVPNAPVVGESQGAILLLGVFGANVGLPQGQVNIPSVRYLAVNNGGDRILAFSSNADTTDAPCSTTTPCFLFVVTPSNIGTGNSVVTPIPSVATNNSLDHPVAAFFSSDDTMAFVVNCGAECGGTQASLQPFDMTTNTPGTPAPVPAASEALVDGSTVYLAGTPYSDGSPSQPCTGQTTAAPTCGVLTILNLNTMQPIQPPNCPTGQQCPVIITDGYHNRISMGANGQLFIGARTCSEIAPPAPSQQAGEVRGCLSIYNTLTTSAGNVPPGGVTIPPVNGDVTGIQPIAARSVVYVVQGYIVPGGSLYIYCATTDVDANCPVADAIQTAPINEPTYAPLMNGNFYDVKGVDF